MGTQPPPLKGHNPEFSANGCCGQTSGWTRLSLGMEVGLGPGDIVFDGNPATPVKRHTHPHPISGPCQTAGWIKMPLGREVGLSPSDIVLDEDPAPPAPPKRGRNMRCRCMRRPPYNVNIVSHVLPFTVTEWHRRRSHEGPGVRTPQKFGCGVFYISDLTKISL